MTSDNPRGAGVVEIKYNDDVKALLRASGMTDEDIAKSEIWRRLLLTTARSRRGLIQKI